MVMPIMSYGSNKKTKLIMPSGLEVPAPQPHGARSATDVYHCAEIAHHLLPEPQSCHKNVAQLATRVTNPTLVCLHREENE